MDNLSVDLVCPSCKAVLCQKGESKLCCNNCNYSWNIDNDVPDFIDTDNFWAEPGFTRDILQKINEDLKRLNWNDVLKDHKSSEVRLHYNFISDYQRAKWFDLINIPTNCTVLDLGAGMGTISQALSRRCKAVYAVEPVKERVDFMRARFEQENCSNIRIIRSDIDKLPFSENKFDLIILNGVLEWLPFNKKDTNPRKAQIYYLKLLKRFLKKGGYIYVGVENRFAYGLFLGNVDPHISIRYVAILPRLIAHIICKIKTGDIYRPYLYSYRGYKHLLQGAGFKFIEIYSALPSYNDPQYIESLEQHSILFKDRIMTSKRKSVQLIKKIFIKTDILKYMGYAYLIFAKKE